MMKKTSKMAAAGVLAAMMALSLAACGGSSNSGAPAPAETQADGSVKTEGRTMKVLNPEEPGAEDALNKAMDAWAAEAGVTLDKMVISHDDQLTKFPSMAKNKDLPDLIQTTRLHQLYPEEFVDMSTVVDTSLFEESA